MTLPPIAAVRRHAGLALLAWMAWLGAGAALAHGPTRQKVIETVVIDAPPAAVWAKLADFDGLKNWHPAVAQSPATQGNTVGSVRRLSLKGGGELVETLERYDAAAMSFSYRAADGGALPVSNYTSTMTVKAEGGGTSVEWKGAFYRGYPNNDPPPELNDDAAVKAITGVYRSGLDNLKKVVEAK